MEGVYVFGCSNATGVQIMGRNSQPPIPDLAVSPYKTQNYNEWERVHQYVRHSTFLNSTVQLHISSSK